MPVVPFIPYIVSAGGVALSAKGASDQKKSANKQNAQTQANWEDQQRREWDRYLLQRGVSNGKAVNASLPFWANVRPTSSGVTSMGAIPSGV